ncbi:Ig-like domain-containing protein [Brevibacillus sp. MER 51]|uniref:Ig-like domain-containing protein n=1 Tax=Brevibacillus sp. MER 51 TaxID=2939560 RepID=UPI00203DA18F|nr:Ig-like domain-containing protein [Brevibacillus sp. MER 51]MCM3143094.1 Ig-like domain-containing protein [Brevibacillus sp. MER 51]
MKKIKNSLMKNVSLAVATICTVQFSVTGIASAQVTTPQPIEAYSMVASTTGLKANVGSVNVTIGDTETIRLTYNGSPIDNALVDWEIGSSSIASVSNGVVYGKKVGTTVVTARYNGYRATVRVTVDRAQTLEATKTEVSVKKGKKTNVSLKFAGSSLPGSRATWKTADKYVATVDDGEIKGVGEGSTVITASYKDQEVEIRVDVEGGGNSDGKLEADVTQLKMEKGDKETIKLTYDDDKLSGSKATWKTSKSSVATVNDDGVVTAKGKGTATITAKYKGYEVEVDVYVDTDSSGKLEADDTSISLKKGDKETVKLKYDGDTLSGSKATWRTSRSSVATVDDGVITAKGTGTATITAEYRGHKVEIEVKVDMSGRLEAEETKISMKKGQQDFVLLKFDNERISLSSATWRTSNSSVATVNSSGVITAQGKGTATITAEYKGYKVEIDVKVDTSSSSDMLEASDTSITLKKGGKETIRLKYDGSSISGSKASWKTSKSSVATVSSSGTITAKAKGTATITATYKGEKVEIEVKVDSKSSGKLEADDTSITIKKGDSEKIKLTYDGDDISSSKAKWKSSKSSVASVSSSGSVKGKKKGKATITAEYKGYEVEIEVTVK